MHDLSIFGTSSDAGKSTLSFAITYLLHHRGISVAPFKAQNVSNNAQVCDEGGEIAQPQYFAAESINISTTPNMNPILIKSGQEGSASLILNGQSVGFKDVRSYYAEIDTLKTHVDRAFLALKEKYDCIVAEGAGSPVELNLMDKDLSNIYLATRFNTKIVLVADIERGGVFASIWGVYNLLPKVLQKNVVGVIVNKFRGDITLFDEGITIIEEQFKLKVLGVIPYQPFNLGFEDSQSLMNYTQELEQTILKVGVIKLPHISNFTDFEPLVADPEVELIFVNSPSQLTHCDLIVIPGTKRTIADLKWLREKGFETIITDTSKPLLAICGGYEMLFERLLDPLGIEENAGTTIEGFNRFDGEITFEKQKELCKGNYTIFGCDVRGYEIHHGQTEHLSAQTHNCYGTFVHGLLESNSFREKLFKNLNVDYQGYDFQAYKKEAITDFTTHVDKHLDLDTIIDALNS